MVRSTSCVTVSVAMATFNGAIYLKEQLLSIARQTTQPDEVIIADDGSVDDTLSIIEEFRSGASFRVLILSDGRRRGYAANFVRAIEHCGGEFVFLSDQDDVWHREKVGRVIDVFKADPTAQVVLHDLAYCDAQLREIGQTKLQRIGSYADPMDSYVTGAAMAVRRSFLELVLPLPEGFDQGHDDWISQCAEVIHAKRIMPEVLALYRRHGENATAASVLNVPRVTTRRDHTRGRLMADSRASLASRVRHWKNQAQWVSSTREALLSGGLVSGSDLTAAEERLMVRVLAGADRLAALSVDRWARIPLVLRILSRGGYRVFSGLRSAAKDLIIN